MRCNCPYVVCKYHGNCTACIAHNRNTGDMAHCMEKVAIERGAHMPHRMPGKVYLEDDYEAMSRRSAELICEVIREKPDALVCLPAGNTAIRTYEIIKELSDKGEVDFSCTRFIALDEWLDLEDESENCDAFMRKHFYGPMGVGDERVTRFDIHSDDLDKVCHDVDEVVFANGGIDVMLLGIGMNGHLGLNEPNNDFSRYSQVVDLDSVTASIGQKYFTKGARLTRGITLGIRHMFDCKRVILQASGQHKAEIIDRMFRTAPTEEIPATVLKLIPCGIVVTDREAAAKVLDLIENR